MKSIKKIIFLILICFFVFNVQNVKAQLLTKKNKVDKSTYLHYKGQKYYDEKGIETDYFQGLDKKCRDFKEADKKCLDFNWIVFTIEKKHIKENKVGYQSIYSDKIYSSVQEALNDDKAQLMLQNKQKKLKIEEEIKQSLKNQQNNNYWNNVNIIIIFISTAILVICSLIYIIVHYKLFKKRK